MQRPSLRMFRILWPMRQVTMIHERCLDGQWRLLACRHLGMFEPTSPSAYPFLLLLSLFSLLPERIYAGSISNVYHSSLTIIIIIIVIVIIIVRIMAAAEVDDGSSYGRNQSVASLAKEFGTVYVPPLVGSEDQETFAELYFDVPLDHGLKNEERLVDLVERCFRDMDEGSGSKLQNRRSSSAMGDPNIHRFKDTSASYKVSTGQLDVFGNPINLPSSSAEDRDDLHTHSPSGMTKAFSPISEGDDLPGPVSLTPVVSNVSHNDASSRASLSTANSRASRDRAPPGPPPGRSPRSLSPTPSSAGSTVTVSSRGSTATGMTGRSSRSGRPPPPPPGARGSGAGRRMPGTGMPPPPPPPPK